MTTEIENKRKKLENGMTRNRQKDKSVFNSYRLALLNFNLGVEMARKEFLDEIVSLSNDFENVYFMSGFYNYFKEGHVVILAREKWEKLKQQLSEVKA